MIRLRRERFIGIAITSERGGNQSSVASAKKETGRAAMPQLLFIFSYYGAYRTPSILRLFLFFFRR
jgi:hypothetical protein